MPRINRALLSFQDAWNNHPLSTEGNWSPLQLFTAFSVGNPLFDHEDDTINPQIYGTDPDQILQEEDDSELDATIIMVPDTTLPLSASSMDTLKLSVDPLGPSTSFGADLYVRAIALVGTLMQSDDLLDD